MTAGADAPTARPAGTTPTPPTHKKPFYVTTPIFYVNAVSAPHIGHMYNMVLADTLKRWHVLLGDRDAKLLTGTDEHGLKIQQAAAAQGLEPQALCDQNCQTFKDLAEATNLSHDHFIRTTDESHKDAVRFFWGPERLTVRPPQDMLKHRDYIYTSTHEGWYCVSDETYYPASQVAPIIEPKTGRKIMASIETGKEVEWSSEENYHFKLSALQQLLLDFYRRNPTWIRPKPYMDQIVAQVEAGLSDLSVSRPSSRLQWGIRVPNDESQTIYVWLDALVNYLTYAGYPFTPGRESASIWPADVHVIGKDILRFHGIYWPAFLLALDLPLPRNILAHAHWTMNRAKMSKSTGNVVNPQFALERFHVDALRYFFVADAALAHDSDYENRTIAERYKKGLQWGLGNLASRLTRSKKWSVAKAVGFAREGKLPGQLEASREEVQELDARQVKLLERVAGHARKHMDGLDPQRALDTIMDAVYQANKYIAAAQPWQMITHADAKPADRTQPHEVDRVVYNGAETLRIVGILMQPFMPTKARQLLDLLGVQDAPEKRSFAAARYGGDLDYGVVNPAAVGGGAPAKGGKKGDPYATLFPPLMTED
ncbi:methionyl-tRNA synthetase [Ascosphaera acerosa]|nr:methionyl-tRNA synthetase [Ascosphaera acerosa]